jgi:hypothetical protein
MSNGMKARMSNVINLRTVRKRARRQQDESDAQARRAIFGRPKAERDKLRAAEALSQRQLDQHRLNDREDR